MMTFSWILMMAAILGDDTLVLHNLHVLDMKTGAFLEGQAVVVKGDHFEEIKPESEVVDLGEATLIDGQGGYLVPGLTDGHVHLDVGAGNRPEFGDAPIYLANGITTVFNMRGDETHLRWRDQVRAGQILGPTIYSCGEFINEPLVKTPEDVRREVLAQKKSGVDFLKFHEYWDHDQKRYLTREGLSDEAYLALIRAASEANLPLTGHGPNNFRLALENGQSFAHLNVLLENALLPENKPAYQRNGLLAQWSSLILAIVSAVACVWRRRALDCLTALAAAAFLYVFFQVSWSLNDAAIYSLVGLSVILVAVTLLAAIRGLALKNPGSRGLSFLQLGSWVALVISLTFWVPLFLSNTNAAADRLIEPLVRKGTPVVTTMVVDTPAWFATQHPTLKYLLPKVAKSWGAFEVGTTSIWQRFLAGDLKVKYWNPILLRLAKKMDDAGAVLVLGTDAMGFPTMVPGESAHFELSLMTEAGLSPLAALKTATVNPAKLVRHEGEFGVIAEGARADALLLAENPLENLDRLRHPEAVLVRGHWLTRTELDRMLEALAEPSTSPAGD